MANKEDNNDTINVLFKLRADLNRFVDLVRLQNRLGKEEALNQIVEWYRDSPAGQKIIEKGIK